MKPVYILWRQDESGRVYSSRMPGNVKTITGNLSRSAVESLALKSAVLVLRLDGDSIEVETLKGEKDG